MPLIPNLTNPRCQHMLQLQGISMGAAALQGNVDPDEWMFLLTGGLGEADAMPNPAPEWLVDRAWKELCRLSKLPSFKVRQHAG